MMEVKARIEARGFTEEGKLVKKDRWVNFPLTDKELMDEIMRCVEDTDEVKLPMFAKRMVRIVEWDVPSFLEKDIEENEEEWGLNLEAVNNLAEKVRGISADVQEILEALIDDGDTFEQAMDIIENEDYHDWRDCSVEDIVREKARDDCGRNIPDYILDNVDYDSAFEDMKDDTYNRWLECGDGYIEVYC